VKEEIDPAQLRPSSIPANRRWPIWDAGRRPRSALVDILPWRFGRGRLVRLWAAGLGRIVPTNSLINRFDCSGRQTTRSCCGLR